METLAEGASGDGVRRLQQALAAAGVDAGVVDGDFGPQTKGGVAAFQGMAGLPETGVADEKTFTLLLAPATSGRPDLFLYRDPKHPHRRHLLSDYGPPPGPGDQGKA